MKCIHVEMLTFLEYCDTTRLISMLISMHC